MDWWCRCEEEKKKKSVLDSALFDSAGQAVVFMLLLPAPSQADKPTERGQRFCFSLLANHRHHQAVPHFNGALVLSFACHQHVCIRFFLTAFVCDIKTQQWTISPFGFPSDP